MKVLFLSRWYPFPPDNGSKLRIYNLLQAVAEQHEVTLISFAAPGEGQRSDDPLRKTCARVEIVPWHEFQPQSQRALLGFFNLKPRWLVDTHSPAMSASIRSAVQSGQHELIIASQISMAAYADDFGGLPALLEEFEVGGLYQRFVEARVPHVRLRHGLTWYKYRAYLRNLLGRFRACTVAAEHERLLAMRVSGNNLRVEVIPNSIDLAKYSAYCDAPRPNTLIYTGSFNYFANHEAMVWFVGQVLPIVRAAIPEVTLTITGDHANKPLPSLEGVNMAGYVDDPYPLIASSWISIAPLLVGGGTRLKILEAMALRAPVIATPKGAEGLDSTPGIHLLLAETPDAFAQSVIRLLQNPGLRQQLSDNAYRLVAEHYSLSTAAPSLLALIESITAH
jgi:glycosyltransferase involved in cell wall biosynthesis